MPHREDWGAENHREAVRAVSALEERGFLKRLPNRARALEVLKQPEDVQAKAPARVADNVVPMKRPEPARPAPAHPTTDRSDSAPGT